VVTIISAASFFFFIRLLQPLPDPHRLLPDLQLGLKLLALPLECFLLRIDRPRRTPVSPMAQGFDHRRQGPALPLVISLAGDPQLPGCFLGAQQPAPHLHDQLRPLPGQGLLVSGGFRIVHR
jgi:hypothetical protein